MKYTPNEDGIYEYGKIKFKKKYIFIINANTKTNYRNNFNK